MRIHYLNIPFWLGVLICMAAVTCTVINYVYYPEAKSWAEGVRQDYAQRGEVPGTSFEPAWFVLNLLDEIVRYGIPALILTAVMLASWGTSNAREFLDDGIQHPIISARAVLSAPYLILAIGFVCCVLSWSRLG